MSYFITGTDTNIGKTLVSSWLCLQTGYDYFKPIQSGAIESRDSLDVQRLSGTFCHAECYSLKASLSPHHAAQLEGITLDLQQITLPPPSKLIVEGAGGVFVPINDQFVMLDLMVKFNLPLIIVARTTLGTINHTLLTIQAIRQRELEIAGIILSGEPNPGNAKTIEHFGNVPVLATLPHLRRIDKQTLLDLPLPPRLKELF
ncbi:MAG: dethiobiotin synthase [Candidatus Paracaedibacteraceae bacterium]|nr:dethiobiotin synthase [Candidatus Paracaedibacteraceae bacterium]